MTAKRGRCGYDARKGKGNKRGRDMGKRKTTGARSGVLVHDRSSGGCGQSASECRGEGK